jgi:hypothetical protein
MVSVNLKGGLGNMMFQIAFIENLARRGGFDVVYPDFEQKLASLITTATHSGLAFDYPGLFKNLDWNKNRDKEYHFTQVRQIPHKFVEIEPEDNTVYDGYFQSEKYFDREFTLKLFEPSEWLQSKLMPFLAKNTCSIHIRRGDYLANPNTYELLDNDYYLAAIDKVKADEYLIFSDDLEWCFRHFNMSEFRYIKNINYVEMYLMAMCNHNIIANSSFSWWGAYLNQNPGKKVIAPAKWYKPQCRYTAMDIYTSNMTII